MADIGRLRNALGHSQAKFGRVETWSISGQSLPAPLLWDAVNERGLAMHAFYQCESNELGTDKGCYCHIVCLAITDPGDSDNIRSVAGAECENRAHARAARVGTMPNRALQWFLCSGPNLDEIRQSRSRNGRLPAKVGDLWSRQPAHGASPHTNTILFTPLLAEIDAGEQNMALGSAMCGETQ